MARKCSSCSIPAPDDESKFCNRCGAAIVDEPEPQFPICGTCGTRVADPEAQFCDKCGGPVKKALACPTCGNPAIDENSKFCTRCGTTFARPNACPGCGFPIPDDKAVFCNRCGASLRSPGPAQATGPTAAPVRKRTPLPIQDEPAPDWDPWSDGSQSDYETPQYSAPPPVDNDSAYRTPQIRMPAKKYAHLPLIADELKDYKKPYTGTDEASESDRKERSKKGALNFMKR